MNTKNLINLLKKAHIIKYGNFKLKNGEYSTYYCDIKQAFGDPKILNAIIMHLLQLIPKKATCIACSGYGGITLASLVAFKMKLPLVLVRDVAKGHGTKKVIDGYVPTNKDTICIIDDVFTMGTSIGKTKESLKMTKCKFAKSVVVLDRSDKGEVVSVLRYTDFI